MYFIKNIDKNSGLKSFWSPTSKRVICRSQIILKTAHHFPSLPRSLLKKFQGTNDPLVLYQFNPQHYANDH